MNFEKLVEVSGRVIFSFQQSFLETLGGSSSFGCRDNEHDSCFDDLGNILYRDEVKWLE